MKSTKKALVLSFVSMLVCVAMLVGSTFAWFTDSVTSGSNRIVAGALKVQLRMDKPDANGAYDGVYEDISNGEGDIFSPTGNGINWEPNKTEIVYLAVKNAESLALKYNILIDVTDNGLVSALEYAIVDGAKATDLATVTDWTALSAVATATGNLAAGRQVAAPNGKLLPDEADYFALAVHMKAEAGNQYMNKEAIIDVTVIATQLNSENDSFGPDYDKDAPMPTVAAIIRETYTAANTEITNVSGANATEIAESAAGYVASATPIKDSADNTVATVTANNTKKILTAAATKAAQDATAAATAATTEDVTVEVNSVEATDLQLGLTVDTKEYSEASVTYNIDLVATLTSKVTTTTTEAGVSTQNITEQTTTLTSAELDTVLADQDLMSTSVNIGAGLRNVKVNHNDDPMTALATAGTEDEGYYYDSTTGELIIKSYTFSPFTVTFMTEDQYAQTLPKAYVTNLDVSALSAIDAFWFAHERMTGPAPENTSDATLCAAYEFAAFQSESDYQAMGDLLKAMGVDDDSKLDRLTEAKIDAAIAEMEELDAQTAARLKQIILNRKDYLNWRCDYEISFNQDIPSGKVFLAGAYDAYGDGRAVAFTLPSMKGGATFRLLDTVYQDYKSDVFHMNYLTICAWVKEFKCGVGYIGSTTSGIDGAEITVTLCIYEVDENGNETERREAIVETTYAFPAVG